MPVPEDCPRHPASEEGLVKIKVAQFSPPIVISKCDYPLCQREPTIALLCTAGTGAVLCVCSRHAENFLARGTFVDITKSPQRATEGWRIEGPQRKAATALWGRVRDALRGAFW